MNKLLNYKERKHTNCEKWDALEKTFGADDLMPMWVADMDFQAPACVLKDLQSYLNHGVFGYYNVPDSYYDAFISWEKTYHNYEVKRDWLRYAPGVVPAFNWWIQIFTEPGDAVIIQQPVYYPFTHAIKNNNRKLVVSHLHNEEGIYTIDFEDFEKKIIDNDVKLFILCSPHNPAGRVWTSEELTKLLEICRKHNVKIISDEIHQDIILGDKKHLPTATIGDYDDLMITLVSATKTFNLAACQNSIVIIPDKTLRNKFDQFTREIRIHEGNSFGYIAVESAFSKGRPWLDELISVIRENYTYMKDTLLESLPELEISPLEGTYLMWVNLKSYVADDKVKEVVQDKAKIAVDYGNWFGTEHYDSFVRFNLATSKEHIEKAAASLIAAIKN